MIASLLIANRGEIARRILRTAARMGIRTVAVYSEADARAPHVREADEAVLIGPAPARESYLDGGKIIAAAKATGAEAIHPGYGFLSENAEFAEAVIAAGLVWVGPPPAAIRAMGLKDAAKDLMAKAGVPVTPGYFGADQSEARLAAEAGKIGWPVLIKAVAGGGGKGMRKVEAAGDFAEALAGARREAAASFGDDRVLLEKFIARARHIEVQVFGDRYGNVVHLFERDCSLQRRHQKVIEEAPAPGMDAATRAALCDAAVRAARAVAYEGAGTIEFIADASGPLSADRIWFMEMNTRLQVEHPVTEAITGQDLVEWQLRVASGEALPLAQDALRIAGHAIEARLYAEDPATGFLPSTGALTRFHTPEGPRVDSAVEEGGVVSPFYDPMIAKLIAHADTREAAVAELAWAMAEVEVWPVKTNAAFLARCLEDEGFRAGAVDTGLIEARGASLTQTPDDPAVVVAAIAAHAGESVWEHAAGERDPHSPWDPAPGGGIGLRLNAPPAVTVVLHGMDGPVRARLRGLVPRSHPLDFAFEIDFADRTWRIEEGVQGIVEVDGRPLRTLVTPDEVVVFADGHAETFRRRPRAGVAGQSGDGAILSPMPGRIVLASVAAGDTVEKGQTLVTLEAMKMEHTLTAPFAGAVAEVTVKAGDQVREGVLLVKLVP